MTCLTDIPIRLLKGPRKAWLSLSGTVLTYRDTSWSRETAVDIPVELISIKEKKRFMGTRLIVALCWLLFSLMAGAVIPTTGRLFSAFVAWVVVAVVPFVVLLIRFFFRQRTVCLVIAPGNNQMSFWVLKKTRAVVDKLLSEIQRRRAYVHEKVPYPQSSYVGYVLDRPFRRTVAGIWLFALPGILLEEPWLFLLCTVPIAKHVWQLTTTVSAPRLFRKALRACLRKEWEEARAVASQLLERSPSYMPANLLLIDINLRLCRFDRAASVLGKIQNDLDAEVLQEIQTDIIQRKRVYERKEMKIDPADGGVLATPSDGASGDRPFSPSSNVP